MMVVRTMNKSDLDFAIQCTLSEDWTSEDGWVFEGFLNFEPGGCFVAQEGDRLIGICIATSYDMSGFIGEFIIVPEMRGRGYGKKLLEHALNYLRDRGVHRIYLDGVPRAVSLYERAGFQKICRSLRFTGKINQNRDNRVKRVERIQGQGLDNVLKIDRQIYGADRSYFLKRLFKLCPELCLVLRVNQEISGYIFGRIYDQNIALGPWVVLDETVNPGTLIENLPVEVLKNPLNIGILENNQKAISSIRSLGFHEKPDPPFRMVLRISNKIIQDVGLNIQCYGIGSPAKG